MTTNDFKAGDLVYRPYFSPKCAGWASSADAIAASVLAYRVVEPQDGICKLVHSDGTLAKASTLGDLPVCASAKEAWDIISEMIERHAAKILALRDIISSRTEPGSFDDTSFTIQPR